MSHETSSRSSYRDVGSLLRVFLKQLGISTVDTAVAFLPVYVGLTFYGIGIIGIGQFVGESFGVVSLTEIFAASTWIALWVSPETILYTIIGIVMWTAGLTFIAFPSGWTSTLDSPVKADELRERLSRVAVALSYTHHKVFTIFVAVMIARLFSMAAGSLNAPALLVPALVPFLILAVVYGEIYNTATCAEGESTFFNQMGAVVSLFWIPVVYPLVAVEHLLQNTDKIREALNEMMEAARDTFNGESGTGATIGEELSRGIGRRLTRSK